MSSYRAGEAVQPLEVINLKSLEGLAQAVIPKLGFDYIVGGSEDEWTLRENVKAFNHRLIIPRVLANIENPDTTTSLLGTSLKAPVVVAPTASNRLAHVSGEEGAAKGAAASGSIFTVSTYANTTIEKTVGASGGGSLWFQLYMSKDMGFNRYLLDRARESGMRAIVLTADLTVPGYREAARLNEFEPPFSLSIVEEYSAQSKETFPDALVNAKQNLCPQDVEDIAEYAGLPVVVKGIQSPQDAEIAIQAGARGIWVSNHGGRQLDGGPGAFDVLETIADRVDKRVPIVFDGGIRRGQHVFKALASGADAVGLGRPILYGLALGGWQGVQSVFDHLHYELSTVMQLAGTQTIEDIKTTSLAKA